MSGPERRGTASDPTTGVRCLAVDDDGVRLAAEADRAVDVLFDRRRIVSFWSLRDTAPAGGARHFRWPPPLRKFLDGQTTVTVVDHLSGGEVWSGEVRLGSGDGRIRVEDAHGNPLGLDKSNRLTRLFTDRSETQVRPLLDAIGTVVDALRVDGVDPFLAYGTLLGAVRDGRLIGHDSDADVGYVSRFSHPVDVAMESFRLQRALQARGLRTSRYSGLAFTVVVREADGSPRGLDVFGGFLREGTLYLMGEVGQPFRRDWIEPLGSVRLEGREFPAPARPDHLLEAMYGPTWQIPDPAFKFTTSAATQRRLGGWFRGTQVGLHERWAGYVERPAAARRRTPSALVRWALRREGALETLVDVGCGDGIDTLWASRRVGRAIGLDYFPRAYRRAARRAERTGLPAEFRWANLTELRSVLVTGAELARTPGPRAVLARHVADATDRHGREHLLRLAEMVCREPGGASGRLYLQVQTRGTPASRTLGVGPLGLDRLEALIERRGGRVEHRVDLDEEAEADLRPAPSTRPALSRLVVTWQR